MFSTGTRGKIVIWRWDDLERVQEEALWDGQTGDKLWGRCMTSKIEEIVMKPNVAQTNLCLRSLLKAKVCTFSSS